MNKRTIKLTLIINTLFALWCNAPNVSMAATILVNCNKVDCSQIGLSYTITNPPIGRMYFSSNSEITVDYVYDPSQGGSWADLYDINIYPNINNQDQYCRFQNITAYPYNGQDKFIFAPPKPISFGYGIKCSLTDDPTSPSPTLNIKKASTATNS